MVTEKTFQKSVIAKIKSTAKAQGLSVFIAKMEAVGQRGFPDLLIVCAGKSLYLELKSPKGTGILSPLQERMHRDLREAGAWVEVAANMETVDQLINTLLR